MKESETLKNLAKAFVGESQARNRYHFYASIARSEGFEQIGAIFLETSDNEKEHAKRIFEEMQKLKGGDKIVVETEVPLVYGTTAENLKASIEGEHFETSEMYPEFAEIAEKEGFVDLADKLRAIAKAEAHHKDRYKKLSAAVEGGSVFKKKKEVEWVCRECGYVHKGKEAPEKCPSCDHAQGFYEVKCESY